MNSLQAMDEISTLLKNQDVVRAQERVLEIEAQGSTLPSSIFELVLKAAVTAQMITRPYAQFCVNSYGRAEYVRMVLEIAPE